MAALIAGATLGLSAGISPGPLLTLVITRTLERGFGAGLRVAIAPLFTDAPIIIISLLLFNALPPWLEIGLTVVGGCFVIYLGVETMRSAAHMQLAGLASAAPAGTDLWRAMLVNILSPHPWLFWITVGGPTLARAWENGPLSAIAFLVGFYGLLVGSKVLVALGVAGGRHYLTDSWYRRLLLASGVLLCLFGLLLLGSVANLLIG